MTPTQVRIFQETKPRDWNGAIIGVDGDLGDHTKWCLAVEDQPRYRRLVVRNACLFRGTIEIPIGSNLGGPIGDWVLDAGGKLGDPWCAAFVYAVLTRSGIPCRRTVSAKQCLEQFEPTDNPQPGDLGGWVNDDDTGHVYPLVGITPEGYDVSMEGNSDNRVRLCARTRDGIQFRKLRFESFAPIVTKAPLIIRATVGTR